MRRSLDSIPGMTRREQDADEVLDLAGQVRPPTINGLPEGYTYGVTRYADVVLEQAFPDLSAICSRHSSGSSRRLMNSEQVAEAGRSSSDGLMTPWVRYSAAVSGCGEVRTSP